MDTRKKMAQFLCQPNFLLKKDTDGSTSFAKRYPRIKGKKIGNKNIHKPSPIFLISIVLVKNN